ncbi:MAG: hypothetical protein JWQ40_118 [Segetibacter sp.]|nr:hypothetical protein [Segetibacter sp.]
MLLAQQITIAKAQKLLVVTGVKPDILPALPASTTANLKEGF